MADHCNFTSIADFLAEAESGSINITATVGQCIGICALAWGRGNPDLSGIGVSTSLARSSGLPRGKGAG